MGILRFLEKINVFPATLLVVPGLPWPAKKIKELRALQDSGYEIAGHGWQHRAGCIHSRWHRLHKMLISGTEAEHLSLSSAEIAKIITGCYRWFEAAGLAPPSLYVPPAWAMGRISKKVLQTLPFRLYETQAGIYDPLTGVFHPVPLTGYMADKRLRTNALKIVNRISTLPFFHYLRIAIHPNDLNLPLADHLKTHLHRCHRFVTHHEFMNF